MNELEVVRTVEAYLHDVKRSKVRDVVDNLYKFYKNKDTELGKVYNEINYCEHLIGKKDNTIEVLQAKIADLEDTNNNLNTTINTLNVEKNTPSRLLDTSKRNYTELLSKYTSLKEVHDDCSANVRKQSIAIANAQEDLTKLRSDNVYLQSNINKLKHNASCSERKHIFYKNCIYCYISSIISNNSIVVVMTY